MFLVARFVYRNRLLAHTRFRTPFNSGLPGPYFPPRQGLQTLATAEAHNPIHVSEQTYDTSLKSRVVLDGDYAFALKSSACDKKKKPAPSPGLNLTPTPETTLSLWVKQDVALVILPVEQAEKRRKCMTLPKRRRVLAIARYQRKVDEAKAITRSSRMENMPSAVDWSVPLGLLLEHSFNSSLETSITPYIPPSNVPKPTRIEHVPIPYKWSKGTLAVYVHIITNLPSAQANLEDHYKGCKPQVVQIEEALGALFSDPTKKGYLSAQALNSALRFSYRYNNISNVRTFLSVAEEAGIKLSTETFNIMLRGTISQKDLQNFTFFLRTMIEKGHRPNIDTWLALIDATWALSAKLHIIKMMGDQGYMNDPITVMEVSQRVVAPQLTGHVRSGQTIDSFFDKIDSIYGSNWLSVSTGNMMCQYLVEEGFLSEAFAIATIMGRRERIPDQVTLNIFLGYFKRLHSRTSARAAFETVRRFQNDYNVLPNELGYDLLFMVCWRARLLNCCRAIWQAACTSLLISRRMYQLVLKSLLRSTPAHPKSLKDYWMKTAGKIIVGLGCEVRQDIEGFTQFKHTPDELLIGWVEKGKPRARMISIANILLQQDLDAGKTYQLDMDLASLLDTAWVFDQEWAKESRLNTAPIEWMMKNSIKPSFSRKRDKSSPRTDGQGNPFLGKQNDTSSEMEQDMIARLDSLQKTYSQLWLSEDT